MFKKIPSFKFTVLSLVLVLAALGFLILKNENTTEATKEDSQYVIAIMNNCLRVGTTSCYKEASEALYEHFELPAILEVFELNEGVPAVFSRCHEVAHYLGRKEYENTKSVAKAFAQASATCHGGSFHGIVEGYFIDKGIPLGETERLEREVVAICGERSDYKLSSIYGECVHGIGHAMMFITEGELHRSLELCDSLLSKSEQKTCYGGVFMENSSSSTNLDHPSKYIVESDPLYPCNTLPEHYLETCYSYQSSHFAILSKSNWPEVVSLCESVPEAYQDGCFRVMGSNQVGFTQDISKMKNNCDEARSEYQKEMCFKGVIDGLVGRFHRDFARTASFCTLLDEKNKDGCYELLGSAMLGWTESEEELELNCASVEKRYIESCVRTMRSRRAGNQRGV